MRVTVRLGRQFARQAGFAERPFDLPEGATAADALSAVARAAPALECVDPAAGTVDLAAASLSVDGRPVDPRSPQGHRLSEGDSLYLFGAVAGG
ncbi:MAG TPA: MoaD/ThiS family protein [Candidatus Thermoplasmatota archaeon]